MYTAEEQDAEANVLSISTGIIFLLSAWFSVFSNSCSSDGCLGLVFVIGGAIIALLNQLFILIPKYCIRRFRLDESVYYFASWWIGSSLAAFVIPLIFAKYL